MSPFPSRSVLLLGLISFALSVPTLPSQDSPERLTYEQATRGGRGGVSFRPETPSGRFGPDGILQVAVPEAKGPRRIAIDPDTMAEAVGVRGPAGGNPEPAARVRVQGGDVQFTTADGAVRALTTGGGCREAHLSDDGAHASFVRGNDLFVAATDGSGTWRVTDDGGATVFNGLLDWVYQEEVYGRGDFQGHWWSSDSQHVAYLRLDETAVKDFTVVDHVPTPKLDDERAVVAEVSKYPKAGDPNPIVSLQIADATGQKVVPVDLSRWPAADEVLIVRVAWTPSGDRALVQVQNRIQDWLELVAVDPESGAITPILKESASTWVNVLGQPHFLADGSFLWWSERTGFQNLYRYDLAGKLLATVTSASFPMTGIERVDEKGGIAYLMGRGESALDSHLYRVDLDGENFTRITEGAGSHSITFSPSGAHFVDSYSSLTTLPELRLCNDIGTVLKLWPARPSPAAAQYGLRDPELLSIPARDGYPLDATVLLPDLSGDAKAPIWIETYSGPDAPSVRNSYRPSTWHQFLRQQGVLVLQCNVRSASGRGQVATGTCHKQMLVGELRDLEDAVAWVCENRGGDPARVGITGYSFGGSISAFALTHSKAFALGVAGAGVYDWQLYDTIYTERYMQTPQLNPAGYAATSVIGAAKDLHGRLILIHGTMDDNVHLQNTLRLAYALEAADKDFEMMLYPKSRHGIAGPLRPHMQRLTWRAIQDTLLGGSIPAMAGSIPPAPDKGAEAQLPLVKLADFSKQQGVDVGKSQWRTTLPAPPVATFPDGVEYFWNLETNVGAIKIKLLPSVAPMHVTSTIYLTQLGFYDGLIFHRVITDFMAQGGCPLGRGNGGPGYKYAGEFDPKVRHTKGGLLSMANAGPGTDGSQFFLTFKATPWLDDKHSIFGEVVEGMDVVKTLEANGSQSGKPKQELKIVRATISWE